MADFSHKIYDNFFLENQISDQFDTHIDAQQFFLVDRELQEGPGMVKKINRYSATDSTEVLAMGEGNSKSIEVTYDTYEYRVKCAQNEFDYFDEQAMTDDQVVPTGVKRMASGMFNAINKDYMDELKKGTQVLTGDSWDIDLFADAVGMISVDGTDNDPKEVKAFAFVNPKDVAVIRKLAKETLQYDERFARQGYVGELYGVSIITKKDQTEGETEVAIMQAVKMFEKTGIEFEQDRDTSDGNKRLNKMWSRKYYIVALVDDTKVVRIVIGHEPTPSIRLDKNALTVAAEATADITATTVPDDAIVTWTSSDDTVATVSDGTVTGVAVGTATITATITVEETDYTATCAVTVTAAG